MAILSDTNTILSSIDSLTGELGNCGRAGYAKTFAALRRSLSGFLNGNDMPLTDVSDTLVKKYLTHLAENGLKQSTICFYFRAFRAFYTHCFPDAKRINPFTGINPGDFKAQPKTIATQRPAAITDTASHWFASKMFRYDMKKISQTVEQYSDDVYMPLIHDAKKVDNKIVERERSLCQLIFFKCNLHKAKEISAALRGQIMIYTTVTATGRQPSVIPDKEMQMFRLITSSGNENLQYFTDNLQKFKTGQRVRVIAGEFEGAEGTIVRIKKDRRLVVTITGICAVATPHLSPALLMNLE